mmetsp:Transcript_104110/g.335672  ORF Transcript_104110/g.335672 Transcript_104110/m.335672 type:complete len:494 (+) Transcript_104110:80-1561(+)
MMACTGAVVCGIADCGGAELSFSVLAETSWGEQVCVVGACPALGDWRPGNGVELRTEPNCYPRWSGRALLPLSAKAAGEVEYKFVIMRPDGSVCWEQGPNRCLFLLPGCKPGADLAASRFGETAAGTREAKIQQPMGVPRELSSTSTCEPGWDEDSRSTAFTSRCASSICLLPANASSDMLCEADEDPLVELAGQAWLWSGAHRVQKPGGSCEDSFFFRSNAVGIADGVSQMADFAEHGVDAAEYAAELMELASRALGPEGLPEACADGPAERAAAALASADAGAASYGASTVTLAALEGACVGVANLGDSGFMLLRPRPWGMEITEKSCEQQHSWNCPYQLTRVPEAIWESSRMSLSDLDSAADAARYEVAVQAGDLLLLFTDGLTDNLHWHEVLRAVDSVVEQGYVEPTVPPEDVARALVLEAQKRSLDPAADTPFARSARRHRQPHYGGKEDDITVVAAWVMSRSATRPGAAFVTLGCPHSADRSRTVES